MKFNCSYLELIEPHKLTPNPKNPNIHSKEQIDRLAKIIDYQGQRSPIVVSNRSGFITKGHGRLEAIKKLGWEKVAIDKQDYEDEAQEYADIVADNAIAEWAQLDLKQINMDFLDLGPELDLEMLGLKDFIIEPLEKLEGLTDEDEVPEVAHPITRRGDIWILGNHRLMCGDSTMIDDVEKLMNGEKADMVFTDPPYNTGMSEKTNTGSTWLSHMFNDNYTDEEWQKFMSDFCVSYDLFTKNNSFIYVCLDWRRSYELVPYLKKHWKFSNLIVWDKLVHGLGSDYKYTHEFIHVCKKGKPPLASNKEGEKEYQDVWRIQRKMGKDEEHATKKPIELCERAIRHGSKYKDNILDLFGGSGSTLIASEKNNRDCFMMELDEKYCDVIIKRWEQYTGKKAILELTNQTYEELKKEREDVGQG